MDQPRWKKQEWRRGRKILNNSHLLQYLMPSSFWYWEAIHGRHLLLLVDFSSSFQVPTPHSRHDVVPTVGWYLPKSQTRQSDNWSCRSASRPASSLKRPASHSVQTRWLLAVEGSSLKRPAAQTEQIPLVPALNFPFGQDSHCDLPELLVSPDVLHVMQRYPVRCHPPNTFIIFPSAQILHVTWFGGTATATGSSLYLPDWQIEHMPELPLFIFPTAHDWQPLLSELLVCPETHAEQSKIPVEPLPTTYLPAAQILHVTWFADNVAASSL